MKLTPPPRPGRARPAAAPADRSRLALVATAIGFAALLAAGVAAFVVLPGWVENRSDERQAPAVPATPGAAGRLEAAPEGGARTNRGGEPDLPAEAPPAAAIPAEKPPAPPPDAGRPKGPSTFTARTSPGPRPSAPPSGLASEITAGIAALDREDFAAAREAFNRAIAIDSASAAAADGLARAEEGLRLAAVLELRRKAGGEEEREAWREAIRLYREALALAPGVEFALEGQARSERRAALADRLDAYIARPDRLSSEEVHSEAAVHLAIASEIEPAGPRLAAQRDRLEELLAAYSAPVRVALLSDGRTSVTVYGVGRLGSFTRRDLELRPGLYTVVGSRAGFRDVRHELRVEAGVEPPPLTVLCKEEI